jgi:hypothetical protein
MFLNWGLESVKWQLNLSGLHRFTFRQAFRAVLAGVAFSLNTPNRIGEYGGRVLFVPEGMRIRAVSLTLAGSFAQLLVTLLAGGIGFFFIWEKLLSVNELLPVASWLRVLQWVVLAAAIAGLLIFFRIGRIVKKMERIPFLRRHARHFSIVGELQPRILVGILLLSVFRFIVFVIQYCLMLQVMGVETGWWEGFWSVSVFFLFMAVVPSIALLELGLRWQFSIIIFGIFSQNILGIYAAATGIWIINLLLPAIAGSILILGVRIFRKE